MTEKIKIKISAKSAKTGQELEKAVSSIEQVEVVANGKPDCDLIIFEIDGNPEDDFRSISALRDSGAIKDIFLTSHDLNPEILLCALRAGIKEVLSQPISEEEVRKAVYNYIKSKRGNFNLQKTKIGSLIIVLGSKGGVGATSIAVNLAAALKKTLPMHEVALVDLNPFWGDIPFHLEIENYSYNWLNLVRNISSADGIFLRGIMIDHASGIKVLAGPAEPLNGMNPEILSAIEECLNLIRNSFDHVVIDIGKNLDFLLRLSLRSGDRVLLICNQNLPSIAAAKKVSNYLRREIGAEPELIINRTDNNSLVTLTEVEKALGRPYFVLPEAREARDAIDHGKLVIDAYPGSNIAKNIRKLAMHILGKQKPGKKGNGNFIINFLNREIRSWK